jgi:hypothetical protein
MTRPTVAACAAIALLTAACGPEAAEPDDSLPPIPSVASVASTLPTSSGPPPPTAAEPETAELITALPPADECRIGEAPTGGAISFTADGVLYQTDTTGEVSCLTQLDQPSAWLLWSPDGDDVLVNPDMLLRNDGSTVATGFFADNQTVRWSTPTGVALIAPKSSTGELIWRDANDAGKRINISFADGITAAAYHPTGTHIIAAGSGRDGNGPGVFIATNRGERATRLASLDDGVAVSELAGDMDGDVVWYVDALADGTTGRLHRLRLSTQEATLVVEDDVALTYLTASTVEPGDVAWQAPRTPSDSPTVVLAAAWSEPVEVQPELDHTSWPLGWLPGDRLLIGSKVVGGATDAPFDLWLWSPSDLQLIRRGVTSAAPRVAAATPADVPAAFGTGNPE